MSDIERRNNIRPDVGGIIAEASQLIEDADVGKLNSLELDEWLKHGIKTYRLPLIGGAIISVGWLAARFVKRILSGRR